MRLWILMLTAVVLAVACAPFSLPRPAGDLSRDVALERYLSGRDLDLVEGIWLWEDSAYEVAIMRNEFGLYPQYDYFGLVTDTIVSGWKRNVSRTLRHFSG